VIAPAPLAPERTALLLIDAQEEHFIAGGPHEVPDGEGALAEAAGLLERARRAGVHVVHVRRVGDDPVFDDFRPGAPGFPFRPEVRPAGGEPVIDRSAAGAFDGTALGERLDDLGVDAVVLAGFTSCGGCAATAREAVGRRLRTVVAADGTAAAPHGSAAAADAHDRALTVQRRLGAEVLSCASIKSLLEAYE
jgi:nicotinamidase-related amidase